MHVNFFSSKVVLWYYTASRQQNFLIAYPSVPKDARKKARISTSCGHCNRLQGILHQFMCILHDAIVDENGQSGSCMT